MTHKSGQAIRFLLKAARTRSDKCVLWPHARNSAGYGHLATGGRTELAHRLICEAANGGAPEDKPYAVHSCGSGNIGCVNPNHLRWASQYENLADAIEHGVIVRGDKVAGAKLTDVEVTLIRADPRPHSVVAALFGVSETNISYIRARKTWRHVP